MTSQAQQGPPYDPGPQSALSGGQSSVAADYGSGTRMPLVSVVIPTYRRPHLVTRAVQSSLLQTLQDIEVIVVLDGPDEATQAELGRIRDPRLRICVLEQNVGAPDARNRGIQMARADWIAPLDDDDEFLPDKLSLQLAAARHSGLRFPIISCRVEAWTDRGRFVWPRRLPWPGEPISEYLFCRHSLFFGEGVLPTHSILVRKELMDRVPYASGLPTYQDLDWTLRAVAVEGAGVEFVETVAPLAIWHMEASRGRVRPRGGASYSVRFVRERRHLMTPRAYAGFLLTWRGSSGPRIKDWSGFWPRLREAFRNGKPSALDVAFHLAYYFSPRILRNWAASASTAVSRRSAQ